MSSLLEVIIPCRVLTKKILNYAKIFTDNNVLVTYIGNKRITSKLPKNVRNYQIEENNLSKKRNFGINKIKAKYIVFMDSDIIPNKNYLSELKKILKKNYLCFAGPNVHTLKKNSLLNNLIAYSYQSFFITG